MSVYISLTTVAIFDCLNKCGLFILYFTTLNVIPDRLSLTSGVWHLVHIGQDLDRDIWGLVLGSPGLVPAARTSGGHLQVTTRPQQ